MSVCTVYQITAVSSGLQNVANKHAQHRVMARTFGNALTHGALRCHSHVAGVIHYCAKTILNCEIEVLRDVEDAEEIGAVVILSTRTFRKWVSSVTSVLGHAEMADNNNTCCHCFNLLPAIQHWCFAWNTRNVQAPQLDAVFLVDPTESYVHKRPLTGWNSNMFSICRQCGCQL